MYRVRPSTEEADMRKKWLAILFGVVLAIAGAAVASAHHGSGKAHHHTGLHGAKRGGPVQSGPVTASPSPTPTGDLNDNDQGDQGDNDQGDLSDNDQGDQNDQGDNEPPAPHASHSHEPQQT